MFKTYFLLTVAVFQAIIGFSAWKSLPVAEQQINISRPVAETQINTTKEVTVVDYQKKIAELGITLHPGTDYTPNSKPTKASLDHCAALVYGTLKVMPKEVLVNLKDLTFYFTDSGRRGLGGGSTIILRCQNVTDEELVSVLVHELGHIMDTGVLKGNFWTIESDFHDGIFPVYQDDLSLDFYKISWKNEKSIKKDATDLDFVSGYAKSDPFEDFAETYNYYLLHGDSFRLMAEHNQAISDKYDFMKKNVFNGKDFNFDSEYKEGLLESRNYDSTVIGYNLEKFLAIS